MSYDTLWQSVLANALFAGLYLLYKGCDRVVRSNCHYSRENGLTIDLPDPDEAS